MYELIMEKNLTSNHNKFPEPINLRAFRAKVSSYSCNDQCMKLGHSQELTEPGYLSIPSICVVWLDNS